MAFIFISDWVGGDAESEDENVILHMLYLPSLVARTLFVESAPDRLVIHISWVVDIIIVIISSISIDFKSRHFKIKMTT